MKAFRFKNKPQTNTYTIYTLIAVALSIFIFSGLDIYINKQVAYLLVTILSSISIYSAIKKAGKEFEEIMVIENDIKFYFHNKMKEPLIIPKAKVSAIVSEGTIEFSNAESKKIIGTAYKDKLENESDWEGLVIHFQPL
jgi:hypothetical protein